MRLQQTSESALRASNVVVHTMRQLYFLPSNRMTTHMHSPSALQRSPDMHATHPGRTVFIMMSTVRVRITQELSMQMRMLPLQDKRE